MRSAATVQTVAALLCRSDGADSLSFFGIIGNSLGNQRPEFFRMVELAKVAEFMDNNIILQSLGWESAALPAFYVIPSLDF